MIQLPAGATQARTLAVVERVEAILHGEPAIANVTSVIGWSFVGSGQNVGMAFVELKDWAKRDVDAMALRDRLNRRFSAILDGDVEAALPPSVASGISDGFTFRLEDRGGVGRCVEGGPRAACRACEGESIALGRAFRRPAGCTAYRLDVDRAKAYALGVPFERIAGGTFGSNYINDFPASGRMRRVIIEADPVARATDTQLMALTVPNRTGDMVPLSAIAAPHWTIGPVMLNRYNGYPSLDISGRAATGTSSGAAMAEMERLVAAAGIGRLGRCGARGAGCRAADAAARRVGARGFHGAGRAVRKLDDSAVRADDRAARHDGCDRGRSRAA